MQMVDKKFIKIKTITYLIYGLYLGTIFLPLLSIAGIFLVYLFASDAKDFLISHYRFLRRTFWLGMICTVLTMLFTLLSMSVSLFIPSSNPLSYSLCLIGFAFLLMILFWWVIRLARGLKSLLESQPISDANRWGF